MLQTFLAQGKDDRIRTKIGGKYLMGVLTNRQLTDLLARDELFHQLVKDDLFRVAKYCINRFVRTEGLIEMNNDTLLDKTLMFYTSGGWIRFTQ